MKTAPRFFSVMILAVHLMWTACSSEPGEKPGDGVRPGETGYFSIGLSTDLNSSRTTDVAGGTDQERLVETLYIILYKASDGTFVTRIPVNATNNNGSDGVGHFSGADVSAELPATGQMVRTVGYPVTAQAYTMIVMANPTPAMLNATDPAGSPITLAAFKEVTGDVATSITPNATMIGSDIRFPMINHRGEVAIGINDLQATQTAAEKASIAVELDRMVAKIEVKKSPDFDDNMAVLIADGKIRAFRNLTWDLDVVNKLSFWMRGKAPNRHGITETGTENKEELYASDPNMDVVSGADYSRNFDAITLNTAYVTANPNAKEVTVAGNVAYTLENTFNAPVQADGSWETQATSILIKAQLLPENQTLGADDWETGYYSVSGFVFTQAEAVNWVNETAPLAPKFPAALSISNLKANALFWNSNSGTAVTTPPADYTVSSLGPETLVFHHHSWNVYRIPIKHFAFDTDGQTRFGHFGVVRNNWYRVVINKINGPGYSSNEKYISADIHILEWLDREQVNDL